jgi:hypothetical protein
MNYSICLDPTTVNNFNVNNLSSNGFSIYTNLNYTTPLQTGITYDQLFLSPLGTCPYIIDLPLGVTQIIVVDNCIQPPVSSDLSGNAVIANCCYAILNILQEPNPWCEECNLSFNVFNTSSIGQIIAGTLSSTCGTVTDYTIGWYRDGDYSSPEFISGFGNAFLPYDNLHPLTGQQAVPCLAGDWEGIIHDIAINGITYSSIAGTANGVPIPFESCFDTVVVNPLTCANGPYSGSSKYSHQINFNGQSVGASPSPVSLTYVLNASVKYFALYFQAFSVWDELEIKWISGDPSATSNPSLYSQPIYLEKLKIGLDSTQGNMSTDSLYYSTYGNNNTLPTISNINNIWPKLSNAYGPFQKVLTLTNLPTSSNPALPDYLDITITPNPLNNNTQWIAAFQCLTTFDCADCQFENWPDSLYKINKIHLKKEYNNGCNQQRIELNISGCKSYSDWMGNNIYDTLPLYSQNLIGSYSNNFTNSILKSPPPPPNPHWINLYEAISCAPIVLNDYHQCGPSSTGTITYSSTANQIEIIFNLESDYLYIKDDLLSVANGLGLTNAIPPIPCPSSIPFGVNKYYSYFQLRYPFQSPTAQCGDSSYLTYGPLFNSNDYFNIIYTENPSSNFWKISIPITPLVNCTNSTSPCTNCNSIIQSFVQSYNNSIPFPSFSYTTFTGAKSTNPFKGRAINVTGTHGKTGSFCADSYRISNVYYWYSINTIPFISSSTSPTGWTNLPSLGASLPCNTSSYLKSSANNDGGAMYQGFTNSYNIRFPHLTSSFNYAFGPGNSYSTNDFEIYASTGFGLTGSLNYTNNMSPPPCPDLSQSLIYRYSGSIVTVYSSSYFVGGSPTLVIDP